MATARTSAPFVAKSSEGLPPCWDSRRSALPPGSEGHAGAAPGSKRFSRGQSSTVLALHAPTSDQVPLTRLKPLGCPEEFPDAIPDGITTMMVCHVPRKYSQALFACELEACGFSGRYDFVYLPIKTACLSAKGFAFVNFTLPKAAKEFHRLFHNSRLRHFSTEKPLVVRPADVQGFDANAEKHCSEPEKYSISPLFLKPLPAHLTRNGFFEQSNQTMKQPESPVRRMAKTSRVVSGRWGCTRCGEIVLPSHNFCAGCGCDLEVTAFMQSL